MHRILLIDDDAHLAAPLAACLRRFDFDLQAALRPSEGLALLARPNAVHGGFDAVILDLMRPEMDGFELCRRSRQQHDIALLMLTACGELSDRIVGLEPGACRAGGSSAAKRPQRSIFGFAARREHRLFVS